jgi:hypothetical protein
LTTSSKDFKVKNGIAVTGSGTFGGPVVVGSPTELNHAVTLEYLDALLASLNITNVDGGNVEGVSVVDGGDPDTTVWTNTLDGGNV